jgi:hypothetical protein
LVEEDVLVASKEPKGPIKLSKTSASLLPLCVKIPHMTLKLTTKAVMMTETLA